MNNTPFMSTTGSYSLREIVAATGLKFEAVSIMPEAIPEQIWDQTITYPWNNVGATPNNITLITKPGQTTRAKFTITDDPGKLVGVPTYGLIHPDPYYAMAQIAELWQEEAIPWVHQGSNGVHSYRHVRLDPTARVGPGTVLGADGFGYYWNSETDRYHKFPHLGGVIIGRDVEIGANCAIDRGSLSNTVIGSGTKIDNLVHIAHNVHIGQHVMVVAHAEVSGSVTVKDRAWLGPSCSIMQGVTIGEGATIGIGAVVLRDVEPGQTVVGHHRVIETKDKQPGVIR